MPRVPHFVVFVLLANVQIQNIIVQFSLRKFLPTKMLSIILEISQKIYLRLNVTHYFCALSLRLVLSQTLQYCYDNESLVVCIIFANSKIQFCLTMTAPEYRNTLPLGYLGWAVCAILKQAIFTPCLNSIITSSLRIRFDDSQLFPNQFFC